MRQVHRFILFKYSKSINMSFSSRYNKMNKMGGRMFIGGRDDDISPGFASSFDTRMQGNTSPPPPSSSNSKFGKMKDFARSNGIVILIIIALILIVIIIVWIVSMVRRSSYKVVNISDKIIRLDKAENMPVTFAGSKFPPSNGQEFTYSFWIYLTDYDVLYMHRTLFRRGGSVDSLNMSNPVVGLDAKTNKMYIAIKTNMSLDVRNMDDVMSKSRKYQHAIIDYVPLQRWVHIAFSVQDSVLTIFMDGDIYSVRSITDISNVDPVRKDGSSMDSSGTRALFSNTLGDMYVGDSKSLIKGFLSRLQFFNYALTQKEIQKLYSSGPVQQTILSMLGLSTYGVRTPIYKIDDVE